MEQFEYAFLGGIYPESNLEEIRGNSKCSLDYAANTLQNLLIKGFDDNIQSKIKLFNRIFVGSYPHKYGLPVIRTIPFSHNGYSEDINIGFLNIFFLRQMLINIVPIKHVVKWAKKDTGKRKVLIVYSTVFLETVAILKLLCPDLYICLIVPDMPIYNELEHSGNIFYKIRNKRRQKLLEKLIMKIDSFVPITETMKEKLDPKGIKPSVVIEGMINSDIIDFSMDSKNDENLTNVENIVSIAYTGTLTKKYGILDLLSAFMSIEDNNYRLIICGGGEAEDEVKMATKQDNRISYKGILSHDEAINVQRQASILINPRPNSGDYTNYSFPSKLLEYLCSGRPVICFKLPGIPREYDDYFIYPNKDGIDGMREVMLKVGSLSVKERDEIGKRNLDFVFANKDCRTQSKIILNMITESVYQ